MAPPNRRGQVSEPRNLDPFHGCSAEGGNGVKHSGSRNAKRRLPRERQPRRRLLRASYRALVRLSPIESFQSVHLVVVIIVVGFVKPPCQHIDCEEFGTSFL